MTLIPVYIIVSVFLQIVLSDLDILEHPESQAVLPGQDLTLNCVAEYSQTQYEMLTYGKQTPLHHVYQWEFNGQMVQDIIIQASLFINQSLFIPKIGAWGYGSYQCIVIAVFEKENVTVTSGVATIVETYLDTFYLSPSLPESVAIGDVITLECVTGRGAPQPRVYWYTNSAVFIGGEQTMATFGYNGAGNSVQLTMQLTFNITVKSSGIYTCVAENPLNGDVVYSEGAEIKLNSPVEKPYFLANPQEYITLFTEKPAMMSCEIGGSLPLTYEWYRNSRIVRGRSPRFKVLPNGTFYILNVQKEDALPYRCSARNAFGTVLSAPINVTVTYLNIEFQAQPVDTVGIAGRAAYLHCGPPLSVPAVQVSWYKDNVPLELRSGEFGVSVLSNWSLEFANVQLLDQGVYTCVAVNELAIPSARTSNTAQLTVFAAPTITEPPINTKITKGELLQLTCRVDGSPKLVVDWYRDDTVLKSDQNDRIDIRLDGKELYIESVNKADEGMYHCHATNTYGQITSPQVFVGVMVPPEIVVGLTDMTVTEGDSVYLSCQVYGDPKPAVTWFHDNVKIDISSPSTFSMNGSGLQIHHIVRQQSGMFKCEAKNEAGSQKSEGKLFVQVPPEALIVPLNNTVNSSAPVVLFCDIFAVPEPDIYWKYNALYQLPRGIVLSNDNKSMVIQKTKAIHTGSYTCVGQNRIGMVKTVAYVFVQVKPTITAITANDVTIAEKFVLDRGDDLELCCKVTGIPAPLNTWYYFELKLFPTSDGRITLPSHSVVIIRFVTSADEGIYQCKVSNTAGVAVRTIQIHVREVLLAPHLNKAVSTSKTSVTINWTAPLQEPHQVITGYVMEYKLVSSLVFMQFDSTIGPDKTTVEVIGLQPATDYVFRVAAVNNIGKGQYSNILGAKTLETAPSAPRRLQVLSHSSRQITLQWEVPQQANGDIKVYQLLYRKKYQVLQEFEKIDISPVTVPLQKYDITDLQPYTTYSIQVRAATAQDHFIMWGDFTALFDFTTSASAPSEAPSKVQLLVTSSTAIQVSWQHISSDNENGPLQGYVIKYTETTITNRTREMLVNPSTKVAVLNNLLPWRYYDVRVSAYNGEGRGPASMVQLARTLAEAPSGAPNKVSVSAMSSTEIKVHWQPVARAEMNCDISGYIVTIQSGKNDDTMSNYVGSPNILQLIIRNLMPWTRYFIRVQAFTTQVQNGFGPFSNVRTIKTEQDVPAAIAELGIVVSPYQIKVNWSSPLPLNGEITGYTIIFGDLNTNRGWQKRASINNQSQDLTINSLSPFVQSYTFESLSSSRSYLVGVAAHTIIGRGPFINRTVHTAAVIPVTVTTESASTVTHTTLLDITEDTKGFTMYSTTLAASGTDNSQNGLSEDTLIGIVVGVVLVVIALVVVMVVFLYCRKKLRDQQPSFPCGESALPDLNSRIGTYPGFNAISNNNKPAPSSQTPSHTESQTESTRSFVKVDPTAFTDGMKYLSNGKAMSSDSTQSSNILRSTSERDSSVPSSVTGPLNYQNSLAATGGTNVATTHLGISNPGFTEEENDRDVNISMESDRHSNSYQQAEEGQSRRSRMDNTLAAIIAAERDRNTSVFNIHDTETLIDTSVIVYDERTAL